jgi:hypothetical protein
MGLTPWLQVVRGIGTSICEDHLLATLREHYRFVKEKSKSDSSNLKPAI